MHLADEPQRNGQVPHPFNAVHLVENADRRIDVVIRSAFMVENHQCMILTVYLTVCADSTSL